MQIELGDGISTLQSIIGALHEVSTHSMFATSLTTYTFLSVSQCFLLTCILKHWKTVKVSIVIELEANSIAATFKKLIAHHLQSHCKYS
jgi:hypothetical protein